MTLGAEPNGTIVVGSLAVTGTIDTFGLARFDARSSMRSVKPTITPRARRRSFWLAISGAAELIRLHLVRVAL